MSNVIDVARGVAQVLADAGVGDWNSAGNAPPTDQADPWIVFKEMPDVPDRCIVITCYVYAVMPGMAQDQFRVQIRCRGAAEDASDVDTIADAAFTTLHGLTYAQFGGVLVNQMLQASSVPMGLDQNRRWERSDNYVIDGTSQSTANRPQ